MIKSTIALLYRREQLAIQPLFHFAQIAHFTTPGFFVIACSQCNIMKYLLSIFLYFHHRINSTPITSFRASQFFLLPAPFTSNNKLTIIAQLAQHSAAYSFSCSAFPTFLRFHLVMPFSPNQNGTFLPELSISRFILTQQPRSPYFHWGCMQPAASFAPLPLHSRPSAKPPAPYAITTTCLSP